MVKANAELLRAPYDLMGAGLVSSNIVVGAERPGIVISDRSTVVSLRQVAAATVANEAPNVRSVVREAAMARVLQHAPASREVEITTSPTPGRRRVSGAAARAHAAGVLQKKLEH